MQKIDLNGIKNIIFDLGGVVVTLDFDEALRRFKEIGCDEIEKVLDPYHQRGIFLALEEGKLSQQEYYDALRREAGKFIPNERIEYAWMGFMKEIPASKLNLLERLKEKYRLFLLSNTNPVIMSWALTPAFSPQGKSIDQFFDKLYLSYKIGCTKPAPAIYEYLFRDSGIKAEETLFIDDGAANIEIGNRLGMKTYLAKNGEDFSYLFD
ncbi:MAG: HAD family phosphatase [Dysgonamonadaceae bacterium]|jgi:putative hydrolase of the HAD superfamily|nr:HAD family phosphatase [Dysgonamonadaceae bacterium]